MGEASDGEAALEAYAARPSDVVLMDIRMPGMAESRPRAGRSSVADGAGADPDDLQRRCLRFRRPAPARSGTC